jgi:hypothetical protein
MGLAERKLQPRAAVGTTNKNDFGTATSLDAGGEVRPLASIPGTFLGSLRNMSDRADGSIRHRTPNAVDRDHRCTNDLNRGAHETDFSRHQTLQAG